MCNRHEHRQRISREKNQSKVWNRICSSETFCFRESRVFDFRNETHSNTVLLKNEASNKTILLYDYMFLSIFARRII